MEEKNTQDCKCKCKWCHKILGLKGLACFYKILSALTLLWAIGTTCYVLYFGFKNGIPAMDVTVFALRIFLV